MNIFTRKAISEIISNESLSPEQKTEQVFGVYGRALDDGYIAKSAAQQAQQTAIESAKAEWEKSISHPDPKESDAYKSLQSEFEGYKAMQTARASEDFAEVKPKFFETVYGMIDRGEGAKSVKDQLSGIREQYEEYFTPAQDDSSTAQKRTPQFSKQPGRASLNPDSEEDKLYSELIKHW